MSIFRQMCAGGFALSLEKRQFTSPNLAAHFLSTIYSTFISRCPRQRVIIQWSGGTVTRCHNTSKYHRFQWNSYAQRWTLQKFVISRGIGAPHVGVSIPPSKFSQRELTIRLYTHGSFASVFITKHIFSVPRKNKTLYSTTRTRTPTFALRIFLRKNFKITHDLSPKSHSGT